MSAQIDWPYLLAFGALLLIALSSATTLWLARVFANRDLDEPAPGRAWERCTMRDDTGMQVRPWTDADESPCRDCGAMTRVCAGLKVCRANPSDDTQPTPVLPKDEK
jgi:hypothetical protein